MELAGQIQLVRKDTIEVLDLLVEKTRVLQLPSPHTQLDEHRARLQTNNYQVLIVGEAKRGKSSLVNALIGRKLVPTDVDISTCQIFRIMRAEHEAYRVRLIDGTAHAIDPDDLLRYGSTIVVDRDKRQELEGATGAPNWHEVINWLEIETPTRFLPKNINIIDTPGLGSLNSAHTQITQRFMPFADAVIFVLDSNQPILQQELQFIEAILDITSHIFFVQTKIDQHKREDWQKLLARNEEILHTHFAFRLSDVHIYPISNVHLLKANLPDSDQIDEDYLRISRYNELRDELQLFLFQAAGWKRANEAVKLATNHHTLGRKILEMRLATSQEKSAQVQAEIQQRMQQRKDQFDSDWSEHGQQQESLKKHLQRIIRNAKRKLYEALKKNGDIEREGQEKIEGLTTINDAMQYNAQLNDWVIESAVAAWHEVYEEVEQHCIKLLTPFLNTTLSLYPDEEIDSSHISVGYTKSLIVQSIWGVVIKATGEESQNALQTAGSLSSVSSALAIIPIAQEALAALAALPLIIAGCKLIHTLVLRNSLLLEDAKKQLAEHLDEVVKSIHQHFFGVDLAIGEKNFIDDFFDTVEDQMTRQLQLTAHSISKNTQLELERLEQETKLDEQQRKRNSEQIREQLNDWDKISVRLEVLAKELKMLEATREII